MKGILMKSKLSTFVGLLMAALCIGFTQQALAEATPEHDGAVTRAEFMKHAEDRFTKTDTNADGTLSREERQAAHKNMRDHIEKRRQKQKSDTPAAAQ